MFRAVVANTRLPSVTAQDVGRELYHGRQDVVQVIGDEHALKKIAWIFQRVPDMFEIRFQYASLIVTRAQAQMGEFETLDTAVKPSLLAVVR